MPASTDQGMKSSVYQTLSGRRAVCSALVGCASVAVTDDAIVQRTAFALALDSKDFTISNWWTTARPAVTRSGPCRAPVQLLRGRVDLGARADGLGGHLHGTGRDGAAGRPPPGGCNALLKAAGKR
jgi:hypothetical protein